MLEVAQACCPEPLLDQVACVFASRYGPLATTTELLRDLAARSPVSPARFTHSVHNAPAGLFSIWARNSNPSSSLAGGKETFAHGFLEAVAMLHRARGRPVLLVTADETPPQPFTAVADRVDSAYALALLLGDGEALEFRLEQARGSSTASAWPDALEFLRWWIVAEATLRITHGPRAWVWTRHD